MERIGEILRALSRRALRSDDNPPALTDIRIESAAEPRLWAEFSNGYETWEPLQPEECFAFCHRNQVWDVRSLRGALWREALAIHAQQVRDLLAESTRRPERRTWFRGYARWLRDGFTANFRPTQQGPGFRRYGPGFMVDEFDGNAQAQERGLRLLMDNLSRSQRQQYEKHRFFDVTGGKSGKRYRIRHGRSMNIDQLDKNGRRVCGWCFFPRGNLVAGDVMLAQKVALELYEADALRVANRIW
jgi:hypothetical protein